MTVSNETPLQSLAPGRGRKLLFILGLFVLAVLTFAAAGVLGYRWFLVPAADDGTCLAFDRRQCAALSASRIEEEAEVRIPRGSTIVDSGASRNLKAGALSALIRLPQGETLGLGSGYGETPVGEAPSNVASDLERQGVHHLDAVASDPPRGASAYFGHDEDGQSWVYVRVVWNG